MKYLACVSSLLMLTVAVGAQMNTTYSSLIMNTFADSSEEQLQDVQVLTTCHSNGGDEAVRKLELTEQKIGQCLNNQVNLVRLKMEADNIFNESSFIGIIPFYLKHCSIVTEVLQCSKDDIRSTVEACFDDQFARVFKVVLDAGLKVMNYTCVEDSFKWLLTPNGYNCFFIPEDNFKNCTTPTMLQLAYQNLTAVNFNEQQCKELDDWNRCVLGYIQGCEDNVPFTHVMNIFNIVRTNIPCQLQTMSAEEFQLGE